MHFASQLQFLLCKKPPVSGGTLSPDPVPELPSSLDSTGEFRPQTPCVTLCVESKTCFKLNYLNSLN